MSWLDGAVVPLAWCWRVERRDGVMLGFTTHDRALWLDGECYAPAPGMTASAIEQTRGLDGDSFDIGGAINSAAISAADLAAGRFDGAAVTLFAVNWTDPEDAPVRIAGGRLGQVVREGAGFTASIDGRDPRLAQRLVPTTSPTCRAELGDGDCRVALAGRELRARVTAVEGRTIVIDQIVADGDYDFGLLRWTEGPWRGRRTIIAGQSGPMLLRLAGEAPPAGCAGAAVVLRQGCDKRAATCAGRYANIANFRGEPHLPGFDLLTRFGGG